MSVLLLGSTSCLGIAYQYLPVSVDLVVGVLFAVYLLLLHIELVSSISYLHVYSVEASVLPPSLPLCCSYVCASSTILLPTVPSCLSVHDSSSATAPASVLCSCYAPVYSI